MTSVHDDRNRCTTSRNRRSTSPETGVRLRPKSVFNFLRKTHYIALSSRVTPTRAPPLRVHSCCNPCRLRTIRFCRFSEESIRNPIAVFRKNLLCRCRQLRDGPAPIVQFDRRFLRRYVDPHEPFCTDQKPGLPERILRLKTQGGVDSMAPSPEPAAQHLRTVQAARLRSASETQHGNSISSEIEARECVNHGNHYGVVRPHPTVHERIASVPERPEKRGRCSSRRRNLPHVLTSVELEIGVMWGLEDIHLAVATVEGWNA